MKLVRLLYISHLAKGIGPAELEDILAVSRKNNVKAGVTGALVYSTNGFLQCLEGPAEVVNELYRTIVRDERHVDVTLLEYSDAVERQFGKWSMAYVREDQIDRQILQEARGTKTFNPFDMTGGEALELLVKIVHDRDQFLAKQQAESGAGTA